MTTQQGDNEEVLNVSEVEMNHLKSLKPAILWSGEEEQLHCTQTN